MVQHSGIVLRRWAVMGATVAALTVAAGCGSDDEETSASTAAPAAAAADDGSAEAKAALAEYTKQPTSIGIDKPLSKKPPTGKNIIFLRCSAPVCGGFYEGLEPAAKALGWSIKSQSFTQTPEGIQSAVGAAIKAKPDGIFYSGLDDALLTEQLAEAEKSGVPIVNTNIPNEPKGPVIGIIHGRENSETEARAPANWIAANGGGKTLTVNIPTYPVLVFGTEAFTEELKAKCADCEVDNLDQQVTDVGTKLPAAIVSRLQRDPQIKNVAFAFGDMSTGVHAALKAAGLAEKVRLVQYGSTSPAQLEDVKAGRMAASSSWSIPYTSWRGIDALARKFVGDDPMISTTAPMPAMLLTKESAAGIKTSSAKSFEYTAPPNYQEEFKKLWLVG
ncbi:MAG: hypothetical protein JWO90_2051 [Solirubrobacterales bacterium]|jgi:ribose transport system substrate-binding protein|nr:hypothetical protein [Solirubrobacterales bacterium]